MLHVSVYRVAATKSLPSRFEPVPSLLILSSHLTHCSFSDERLASVRSTSTLSSRAGPFYQLIFESVSGVMDGCCCASANQETASSYGTRAFTAMRYRISVARGAVGSIARLPQPRHALPCEREWRRPAYPPAAPQERAARQHREHDGRAEPDAQRAHGPHKLQRPHVALELQLPGRLTSSNGLL